MYSPRWLFLVPGLLLSVLGAELAFPAPRSDVEHPFHSNRLFQFLYERPRFEDRFPPSSEHISAP